MNSTQSRYALKRIRQIVEEKIGNLRKGLVLSPNSYKAHELVEMIRSGKAKLKTKAVCAEIVANSYGSDRIDRYFTFPKPKLTSKQVRTNEAIRAKMKKIQDTGNAAADQVILGDEAEALRLIDQLMKM